MISRFSLSVWGLLVCLAAAADPVTVTESPVYITRNDCQALVGHQPSTDVTYKPGVDVHGKYVAPADLPGSQMSGLVPDKITFDLKINPLAYAPALPTAQGQKFANTAMPLAHVEVDLKTGETRLNGRPLDDAQTLVVREACRKAGFQ